MHGDIPSARPPPAQLRERPWLRFYDPGVPASLDYPDTSPWRIVARRAGGRPDAIAWDFFGTLSSYARLGEDIQACSRALAALGVARGDRLLIAMPTVPQAVIAFYAANRLGAVCAFIHPLSTSAEIGRYLDASGARVALTLDAFHGSFARATPRAPLRHLLLARIGDCLSPPKRLGIWLRKGWRIPRVPADPRVRWWRDLMSRPLPAAEEAGSGGRHAAAILFSGGTTGEPKGIVLSNGNLIAQGMQTAAWGRLGPDHVMLAILPLFHGFGLGVCINATLMAGGRALLVPQFDADLVARLVRRKRPNVIVGVPTLYEALARSRRLRRADLSCLQAAFCGADTLPQAVRHDFEALVRRGGGSLRLLQGYGLTEAVTAVMAMPAGQDREGSIGLPFPDMEAEVFRPGGDQPMPVGEEGEICLRGPSVMRGYLDDPDATAQTLRRHADGTTWLHTGDLGRRDADGFFWFSVRLKRMIKSSGFNVYPAQVEEVLRRHPAVAAACVIGVADPRQVERVVAVVVPCPGARAGAALGDELIAHCQKHLIKWSCPREVRFRGALPLTRVGKVDYRALAGEDIA